MTLAINPGLRLWTHVAAALLGAAVAATAAWQVQAWRLGAKVAVVEKREATGRADRAEAARTDESNTATLEQKHAEDTIYNADNLAGIKTGIDIDVRGELERARRLQHEAASRAATYRAQAQADAAARSDLADKTAALDSQLAKGIGVVAELSGVVRQRDAEVMALCEQVGIERVLAGGSRDSCGQ